MKKNKMTTDENGVVRYKLDNGAILLIKSDSSSPVVSLNLWIEAGAIDEKKDERGMAHLIEHMIFKGTQNRGVGVISKEVEAAGGYLNAFTSFEHTCFYVVLPSDKIEKALEVEFDAYLNSVFDADELEKEKEVVFEEMRMRQDDPWSWSWELLFRILYQNNPYHWPVIGDMTVLKKVPREKLLNYYKKHYVPSNTVISIVGDVLPKKIIDWISRNFEAKTAAKPPRRQFSFDDEPKKLQVYTEAGDVQQVYLSLGYPSVSITHPDAAALEVLDSVLGEGHASRLNLNIREKNQLADEVGTESFFGKFGGAFLFQALTDAKRIDKLLVEMMKEVRNLISEGVDEKELFKIKNKIQASKIYEKQSVDGQAKTLGFWELQGNYQMEDRFLKNLNAVKSEDLRRVAHQYLKPSRASLVLYYPKSQKMSGQAFRWQKLLESGFKPTLHPPKKKVSKVSDVKRFKLQNGSILIVKERKGLPLLSLGLFVKGGFLNETSANQGITSLMTKCLFKGTQKRSYQDFSRETESLASHLDTQMDKDYWSLSLESLKDNFEPSLDLLLETTFTPLFSDDEIKKEKQMQIAALERLKDDPSEYSMLHSDRLTFQNTPYAHIPMGTVESIKGISSQAIRRWHSERFSVKNMTWIVVGDANGDEIKKLLDEKLKTYPIRNQFKETKTSLGLLTPTNYQLKTAHNQASLVLGFRAPTFKSNEFYGFRVLNTILNGMGGELFVQLREKKSLAYSVYASHDAAEKAGVYQIYIGCAPPKVKEAKQGLLTVLQSVADRKVSNEELERAKSYMIGLFKVGQQSNRAQLFALGRHELIGFGVSALDHYDQLIRKVTAEEVQRLARKYLNTHKKTWVLLSPKK
jgi:zinc protease